MIKSLMLEFVRAAIRVGSGRRLLKFGSNVMI
jgi:hypothetical protein